MGLVYDYKNIKVDFFSNKEIDDEKYYKKLIVYPILEYKVFAPTFDDIKLNLFQKTVLCILNKGKYDVEKISEWLCMDKVLTQMIFAELQIKGLIDSKSNNITKEGKELIDGTFTWFTNSESLKKDIRYIYQDVYTNNLYPVLIDKENMKSNVYFESNKIKTYSRGEPQSFDFIQVEPRGKVLNYISKPNNKKIFQAINEHSKIYIENSDNNIDVVPEAIQLLCEEPNLTYIATWIYIDKTNKNEDEIEVSDPFNIYDNGYYLKENIEQALKSDDNLKQTIENLVVDAKEKEKEQMSEVFQKIDIDTMKYLDKTFDSSIKKYDVLYDGLKSYYKYFEQYKTDKNNIQLLKSSITKSQNIFETFFEILQKEYPLGYKKVYDDKIKPKIKDNKDRFYNISIDELKIIIEKINPECIIPKFPYTDFKKLNSCITNTNGSLRDLYIGAMLASYYDNTNPMYQLIKQEKNILVLLQEVIPEKRNKTDAHKHVIIEDGKGYENTALEIKDDIKQIIKIFLEEVNNG